MFYINAVNVFLRLPHYTLFCLVIMQRNLRSISYTISVTNNVLCLIKARVDFRLNEQEVSR